MTHPAIDSSPPLAASETQQSSSTMPKARPVLASRAPIHLNPFVAELPECEAFTKFLRDYGSRPPLGATAPHNAPPPQ